MVMIRRPPRSTQSRSSAASDVYKRQRKGFQKVLDNPSKHGRENVNENNGRFFEDYCNWERIEEFKDCICLLYTSPSPRD